MIDKKIKDLYEDTLEHTLFFLSTVKINDIKGSALPKDIKDFIWKKMAIPFKSYLHINDLTWEDVRDNIINKTKEMAKAFSMNEELKEMADKNKGLDADVEIVVTVKSSDIFDPMETRIIAFINESMGALLEANGIETDTAFNEYVTYMADCMEEENKVA